MAKFTKGNQAAKGKGRPHGSYRGALLECIDPARFRVLVEALYRKALDEGDMTAAQVLINRLVPPLKPRSEAQPFTLPDGALLDQARAVMAAVAAGTIAIDDAKAMLSALADVAKIQEITDLIPRLEALEGGYV